MASKKIQRINEDIQRVLATLLRNIKDPRINQGMISVTAVDTTNDLHQAKVYLSVFGLQSEKELSRGLKSATGYLRRELGQSLSLRHTPELHFELDKSIERGAHISTILHGLDLTSDHSEAEQEDDGQVVEGTSDGGAGTPAEAEPDDEGQKFLRTSGSGTGAAAGAEPEDDEEVSP